IRITGSPTQAGTKTVTISAYDGFDSTFRSFSWQVTNNQKPNLPSIASQSNRVGDQVDLGSISASDADGDPLTFSATNLPAGLNIDVNTGRIAGELQQEGSFSVTVSVSDGYDQVSTSFTWNVILNQAPVITGAESQIHQVGANVSVRFSVSDGNGDPVTTSAQGLPPGLSFDAAATTIYGQVSSVGSYTVLLTADDGYDATQQSLDWEVFDIEVPTPVQTTQRIVPVPSADAATEENYLLWSVPGDLDGLVTSDLFDGARYWYDWRLVADNGADADYYVEQLNGTIETGRAYWLLTTTLPKLPSTTRSLVVDKPYYEHPLTAGWNLIGNPWFEDVSWTAIRSANALDEGAALYGYQEGFVLSNELQTGLGYYFNNESYGLATLRIPYPFASQLGKGSNSEPHQLPPDASLIARVTTQDESGIEAHLVLLGESQAATDELDALDLELPRGIGQLSGLYSSVDRTPTITDIRKTAESQVFELALQSRATPRRLVIEAASAGLRLISSDGGGTIHIAAGDSYETSLTSTWMGYVVKGDVELVSILANGADLSMAIYPNPTYGIVNVRLLSRQAGRLKVELYDVQGRRIANLFDQYVEEDHMGIIRKEMDLAPGVYFVRMSQGANSSTAPLTVSR
ncbi:MAG: T9SS C-terminal target domain-containing protein, partial [Bacteroidetes bacterium]|nr:T9SS C-terminal target domain-containing protein [Bacteroidota bacterium]